MFPNARTGRGTGPNEQIGNIRFRALVRHVIQETGLKDLDGKVKAKLARDVIKQVKAKGGRFVKRVELGSTVSSGEKGSGKLADRYEEVDESSALDKTKQSFRHQLRAMLVLPKRSDKGNRHRASTIRNPIPLQPTSSSSTQPTDYFADGLFKLQNSLVRSPLLNSFAGLANPSTLSIPQQQGNSKNDRKGLSLLPLALASEEAMRKEILTFYLAESLAANAREKALLSRQLAASLGPLSAAARHHDAALSSFWGDAGRLASATSTGGNSVHSSPSAGGLRGLTGTNSSLLEAVLAGVCNVR